MEVVYQGRRGWVNSRFLAPDPTYSAPNAVAAGTRVALVVGVNAYADTLPTLQNPIPDARAVAVTLSNLGFRVRLLTDPDAQSIRQGLAWLVEQGSQAEAIMFYFAGHGLSVRGQSALVALPSEGVVSSLSDIDQQMVLLGDVIRIMEASPARSKLVFLDACRNTPRFVEILQRSQNPELANAARGLGRIAAGRNFFVVYSTDPQNVASDGPSDQNSPFAGALLARMVEPNVTINETLRLVRQDVIAQTRGAQSPWVEESLSAEFQFAALPAVTPEHFFGGLISEHLMGVIGSDGTVIEYALDPDEPPRAELTERTCGRPLELRVGEMTPSEVVRWIEASGADAMYGIFDSDALIERFEAMSASPGRPKVPYLETRCTDPETGGSIWHFDLGGGDLLIVDFSREGYEGWNRYFVGLTN